jgi:hypothetical protein
LSRKFGRRTGGKEYPPDTKTANQQKRDYYRPYAQSAVRRTLDSTKYPQVDFTKYPQTGYAPLAGC